ncbi:MAG: hypothetical protein ABL971_08740 [Vicinamibacterales bacterium]
MGAEIADLKRALLREVGALSHNDGVAWKMPILDVLAELRHCGVQAVLFGGTLRSLLTARFLEGRRGRPRDIDVVVSGVPLDDLEDRFRAILSRRTRFGGLQLRRGRWQFDVWPVRDTWAFKEEQAAEATFSELPSTTTFNLEAIAVEAWPTSSRSRALFAGDDQFFEGILSRTLELNRDCGPFPELTVVRGLVMASELRFRIGPRFARHVRECGPSLSEERLDQVQYSHYGYSRLDSRTLHALITSVLRNPIDGREVYLPAVGQLHLW